MKNLFQRGFAAMRSLYVLAFASLLALAASPVLATPSTPVATIKAKIESAGADWVEILVAIALIVWAAYGVRLLFKK